MAVKNAVSNAVNLSVVFDTGRSSSKAVTRMNRANPVASMNGVVNILWG